MRPRLPLVSPFIKEGYSSATGQDRGAYEIMTGAQMPLSISHEFLEKYGVSDGQLPDFHMVDMRGVPIPLRVSGNFATFTDFTSPENSAKGTARIDFIFGDSGRAWYVSAPPTHFS